MTLASKTPTAPAEPLLNNILDTLGTEIVSGIIPEGDTFTLNDLSTRFKISRTVAREVMRALEQLGLVLSSRRVGIKVLPASQWDVFDQAVIGWRWKADAQRQLKELSELRFSVEPVAAVIAARHAEKSEAEELIAMAEAMVKLADEGNSEEFLATDLKFHTLILKASRNEMFHALAPSILHALEGRTLYGEKGSIPGPDAVEAHFALAEAIAAGDPDGAERASKVVMADISPCHSC
ncbi:FadR/GntR family transcriptional regulator [Corynebacterium sanguinis]|uniref:FadR/GntR family transcriptional regulator n=1 Tax=Corynebacterium sanguinis TaxID=2594913 RepID=UPI0011A9E346|nr:FCD domain-containing protein [Corynebacterium sanguinis]MCT1414085.1 FCD domain-containing protein [Corynebacterium sanguinis]MCT1426047.1 FCD domain-containing protein [Corynebacterium sanguinis]MCT1444184.1 FCD domain-containing protein [Corynebacterium sanguinis]MCT1491727.1 FCD domain-containing protein [Corynebacterium sanguinis]MCT1499213.1 FCD domain-containing protein [Corynebacterium sanguinis]